MLDCNPYENTRLSLICTAEGPFTPILTVIFIWMRRRDGSDEILVDSQQRVTIVNNITISMQLIVRHDSRLTVSELSETADTGEYWCQVRLPNGTVLQKKSNVLTLDNEAQYRSRAPCSGSQVVDKEECIPPLQVTLPVATDATDTQTPDPGSAAQTTVPSTSQVPQVTGDATEEPESKADFYAIVAVIVVFCILIVALSIIIVMLCKRKRGPVRFKTRSGKQRFCRYLHVLL